MCVLHVSGKNLDPAALLEGTHLYAYRVYQVGQPRRHFPDGSRHTSSGFSVNVSDASWSDLRQQVEDACEFLDRHAEDIRRILDSGTVDDMRLDFPIHSRLGEKFAQFDLFPAKLVTMAGVFGIGLELSTYRVPEEQTAGPGDRAG